MALKDLNQRQRYQAVSLLGLLIGVLLSSLFISIQLGQPGQQLKHQGEDLSCFPSHYQFEYREDKGLNQSVIEVTPTNNKSGGGTS